MPDRYCFSSNFLLGILAYNFCFVRENQYLIQNFGWNDPPLMKRRRAVHDGIGRKQKVGYKRVGEGGKRPMEKGLFEMYDMI